MAEEEVPLSVEEAAESARKLILQSPPGQALFVVEDLSKLLPALTDDFKAATLASYNIASALSLPTPDSHVVVTEAGQVAPDAFVDTKTRTVVHVNHQTQEASPVPAEPAPEGFFDASIEEHRASLLQAAKKHVASLHGSATLTGYEVYSKAGTLTLVISGLVKNLSNFYSGHWLSKWTVTPAGESAEVTGSTTTTTHYYENGNVQMNNTKQHSTTVAFGPPGNLGAAVMKAIADFDDDLIANLAEMYENMKSQTLKEIRRFLPVSGTKFTWSLSAIEMRQRLMERK